jgi:uncharacterized protein YcgL (UPF0745 family)
MEVQMKVSSYKSKSKQLLSVLVPQGTTPTSLGIKDLDSFGPFEHWKDFELDASQPRVALDPAQAIKDITRQGYHLNQAQITTTLTAGGGHVIERNQTPKT